MRYSLDPGLASSSASLRVYQSHTQPAAFEAEVPITQSSSGCVQFAMQSHRYFIISQADVRSTTLTSFQHR